MLNLAQLRSFVVVAEELSFSKAAQRLYVTQPGLSRQVRLLEESLGIAPLRRPSPGRAPSTRPRPVPRRDDRVAGTREHRGRADVG